VCNETKPGAQDCKAMQLSWPTLTGDPSPVKVSTFTGEALRGRASPVKLATARLHRVKGGTIPGGGTLTGKA